jgi:hypothetical protein
MDRREEGIRQKSVLKCAKMWNLLVGAALTPRQAASIEEKT